VPREEATNLKKESQQQLSITIGKLVLGGCFGESRVQEVVNEVVLRRVFTKRDVGA